VLDAAIRLARLHGIATLSEREVEVDTAAIGAALIVVRGQLDAIRALKTQLTSIGTMSREVNGGLDRMRDGVLAAVADVERALKLAATPQVALQAAG
jgi:hypothetical protein